MFKGLFFSLVSIVLLVLLDLYVVKFASSAFPKQSLLKSVSVIISIGLWLLILIFFYLRFFKHDEDVAPVLFSVWLLFFLVKLWILIFASGFSLIAFLESLLLKSSLYEESIFNASRRLFVKKGLIISSLLPFVSVLHGITLGRFNYKIHKERLSFKDLPASFDGLKVLQISDLHLGSFKNKKEVQRGVDLIKQQNADLVLFTGDMVNYKSDEVLPWVDMLSEINPLYGKFSIMGNHDYGDYVRWEDEKEKKENMAQFESLHKEMGFKLLRNQNLTIEKGEEKIYIAGSENWGKGIFSKYGDIDKTLNNVPESAFTILMSHDPSHFDLQVKQHANFVHLTLSGHTHGMQFGIEVPGFIKWSPVKYRYPKWAGLYEESSKYLYVNRGFGYIGFPGRVGIWPEITVLELKKA
jgi:hypothetical protein